MILHIMKYTGVESVFYQAYISLLKNCIFLKNTNEKAKKKKEEQKK